MIEDRGRWKRVIEWAEEISDMPPPNKGSREEEEPCLELHACALLLVGSQLPLPLLHIGRALLKRCRQPCVVILQRVKFHLPLLCVR